MNRKKLTVLVAGLALAGLGAACGGDDHANNSSNNTAIVRNTNANTNANANANTNANRSMNYNANMTREDYERSKEGYAEEARKTGSKVGTGANDGWLWVKVKAALAAADDLRDSTINVDVDNAVVTLNGTVASGTQKTRAVDVAGKVEGVKRPVNNKLTVRGDGATSNTNTNTGAKK